MIPSDSTYPLKKKIESEIPRLPTIKAEFKSLKNENEFSKSEIREEKHESQKIETIQLEKSTDDTIWFHMHLEEENWEWNSNS